MSYSNNIIDITYFIIATFDFIRIIYMKKCESEYHNTVKKKLIRGSMVLKKYKI